MTKVITGDRIGRTATIRTGCSAVIFDESSERILLTRRADNGQWCLPSGGMDAGESITETCEREVREETGLKVHVVRFIGVYSSPHRIVQYADGNRFQIVAFSFEAEVIGGQLTLSDETTEFGYFTPDEIETLDLMELHHERIADALTQQEKPFVR